MTRTYRYARRADHGTYRDVSYRYTLTREVDDLGVGCLCWVMLNPSTADDSVDDPTIRRVMRFTRDHGYRYLTVVNLFAVRSTNPASLADMLDAGVDIVGEGNDSAMMGAFCVSDAVVFAWGASAPHSIALAARERRVIELCASESNRCEPSRPPVCLGVTAQGHPRHPLYIHASTRLTPFTRENHT